MPRRRLTPKHYRYKKNNTKVSVLDAARRSPPMTFKAGRNTCDFSSWYKCGIDNITRHLHATIWERQTSGTYAATSIFGQWTSVSKEFIVFLQDVAAIESKPITLRHITKELVIAFIDWLRHRPAETATGRLEETSQRTVYKNVKTVLQAMSNRRLIPPAKLLFPFNPYPKANQRAKSAKAFSNQEQKHVLRALLDDLAKWKAGLLRLPQSHVLGLYFFFLAARSGRNTTPLLELTRDALRPHPIKPNRWLLVTYKRRGYTTHIQSFAKPSEGVSTITPVRYDVVSIYEQVLQMTQPMVDMAAAAVRNNLWIFQSEEAEHKSRRTICTLTQNQIGRVAADFVARHALKADDGSPLRVNVSKFRKTFVNQIFHETGGNIFATSLLAGHTPQIADTNYLEAPPEAERNFKWVGEALVDTLRYQTGRSAGELTPVAHCRDTVFGEFAPKNGKSHCVSFLLCFKCHDQIVTGDDLYRLFSFYWLLVRERNHLPRNRWAKRYGWVIREIDDSIAPRFPKLLVDTARTRAQNDPHPMWRTRESLLGFVGEGS